MWVHTKFNNKQFLGTRAAPAPSEGGGKEVQLGLAWVPGPAAPWEGGEHFQFKHHAGPLEGSGRHTRLTNRGGVETPPRCVQGPFCTIRRWSFLRDLLLFPLQDRLLLIVSDWDKLGSLISMYLLHLWQYRGGVVVGGWGGVWGDISLPRELCEAERV